MKVLRYNGVGFTEVDTAYVPQLGMNADRTKLLVGDVNGDGKDDVMVVFEQGAAWWRVWVSLANGSGTVFAAPAMWHENPAGWADYRRAQWFAGDFNGDGKAEFGHFYNYDNCQTKFWAHRSTGTSFTGGAMKWDGGTWNWCWDRGNPVVVDFDGNGTSDVVSTYRYDNCWTKIWLWRNTADAAQEAGFSSAGAGELDLGNGWCADKTQLIPGDYSGDNLGDLRIFYHCCGANQHQLWSTQSASSSLSSPVLSRQGGIGPIGTRNLTVESGQPYKLVARHSGLCLDIGYNSVANGATVWQWGCQGYANQSFRLVSEGAHYMLRPTHTSGMCISAGSSPTNGTVAFQYQCGPYPGAKPYADQVYKVEYVSGSGDNTLVRLRPVHSDKCLDVSGVSMNEGAVIHQYDCHGGANQDFYLVRTSVVPYNLRGSYAMNESGGSTLADSSGRNATATLAGGATVSGGYGTFNGSTGYAATSGPAVDTSQSYTVSAWVRLTSGANYATAVSQDGNSVGGFNLGYQPPQDGNVWAFELRNQDGYVNGAKSRASAPATLNTWTHLVGVRDVGSGQIRLYVNGQLVSTAGYGYQWNASGPLTIGRYQWGGGPADFWPGDIDDVRIYNRVLDAGEIATLYGTRN